MELSADAQLWVNDLVVWLGYGTVVGRLAKAGWPGRDPGGAVATLAMGIAGVVIGCGVWSLVTDGDRVTPIGPAGLVCGTLGAFVILLFYRVLGGFWYDDRLPRHRLRRRSMRRRRYRVADYYE